MRRVLALALLIGAMFGLAQLGEWLDASVIEADIKTLVGMGITFAGIGFVVLAAYVFAAAGASFKPLPLPRVTGYILAGIALGPYVSGVLRKEVVTDLESFNMLALALIALEAGIELQVSAIKKVSSSLLSIVAFKIPLSWIMVGGAFVLASPLLPFELSTAETLTIGLVIGALAVGTSPAVSIAVIGERGSKGKTPDLVLSIAIFKDIVMILMLAVAITVGQSLLTDSEMSADSFLKLGKKIALSLAAGALLGAALIAFMRWVRWQLVLTLLIVAYGGAVLSDVLHLKTLLVFIAAGFVVSNFSPYGHDLHKPLALLALPIFIVFFTSAGAKLDLSATMAVLPVALILFVVRLGMLYGATKLGGKVAKDPPQFTNNVWLGFVSQAGVALGLLLMAQRDLESISGPLGQIAVALIALNLLIGPILLGVALKRAAAFEVDPADPVPGPIPTAAEAARRSASDLEGGAITLPGFPSPIGSFAADQPSILMDGAVADSELEDPKPDFGPGPQDPALALVHAEMSEHLHEVVERVVADVLSAWKRDAAVRLDAIVGEPPEDPGTIHAGLEPVPLIDAATILRQAAREVRNTLAALPGKIQRPLLPHHVVASSDASLTLRQRMACRWQKLTNRHRRTVALRLVARTYVEGVFVCGLQRALANLAAIEARRITELDTAFTDALELARETAEPGAIWQEPALPMDALHGQIDELAAAWASELEACRDEALGRLGAALREAGTGAASGAHRYETVAMVVDQAIKSLDNDGREWDQALAALAGRARLRAVLEEMETGLGHEMTMVVRQFTSGQQVDVSTVVDGVREALQDARTKLAAELPSMAPAMATARLNREAAWLEDVVTREALPRINQVRHGGDATEGVFAAVTRSLTDTIEDLDEEWPALPAAFVWDEPTSPLLPSEVPVKTISVRALAKRYVIGELKWAYDDAGTQAERMIDRVAVRLGEAAGVITYGLRTAITEITGEESANEGDSGAIGARSSTSPKRGVPQVGVDITLGSLDRAIKIVDGLSAELQATVESMPESIASLTHDAFGTLRQRALGEEQRADSSASASPLERARRSIQTAWHDIGEGYAGLRRGLTDLYGRFAMSTFARDARVRAGLEEVDEAAMAQDVDLFDVARSQRDKLPYVLAKLFEGSALDTPQILAGAERERAAIAEAWTRFRGGTPTAVLLTGDSGSGKTSVAHVVLRELSGRRLSEVKLHPFERNESGFCATVGAEAGCFDARTFDALASALTSRPERTTILLDGLEQIFERTPEGLAHMRGVLGLIMRTRDSVCWVAAMNSPTARLLEHLCDIKAYFTDWIAFNPRSGEEIVCLIEARARLAGFAIEWPQATVHNFWDRLRPSIWQRDDEARRRRFAKRLSQVAAGNVRDGIAVFVNAVDTVEEEVVRLQEVRAPALSWFSRIGRDPQRVLALTVLTGSISVDEANVALRWPSHRLDASMSRLIGAQLLVRAEQAPGDEPGARWQVRGAVWRRVCELLAENNLLIDPHRGPSRRERQ